MVKITGGPSQITSIILDDKKIIGYRPRLNEQTGGVISTIILCQAMYWAKQSGNPFYKFRKACGHGAYKPGDSWCEELGLTGTEFDTGLKRIGAKISRKEAADPEALLWYWNDMDRKTYYAVNWDKVNQVIAAAYEIQESAITKFRNVEFPNSGKQDYEVKDSLISIKETTKTQPLPTNTSSSVPCKAEIKAELMELGLDEDEAKRLLQIWQGFILYQKIIDIKDAYKTGKVGNLLAYAKKVLSQRKLYTPQEAQEIYKKYLYMDKKTADKKAEAILDETKERQELEFIATTDTLINKMDDDMLKAFEKHLTSKGNRFLIKSYAEDGITGMFVKTELRSWILKQVKIGKLTKGDEDNE